MDEAQLVSQLRQLLEGKTAEDVEKFINSVLAPTGRVMTWVGEPPAGVMTWVGSPEKPEQAGRVMTWVGEPSTKQAPVSDAAEVVAQLSRARHR